jgi:sirohydrochlorin cobaltochelatase
MRKIKVVVMLTLLILAMSITAEAVMNSVEKPTIVLVAFGTSVDEARKVFDHIDDITKEHYAEYDVRWAFTSQFIIDKLKKQGIITQNVQDVVDDLRQAGVKKVVFQSLHVVPGQEYHKVKQVDMSGLEVAFGDALLATEQDIDDVINALADQIDVTQPTVIVAHGNDRHPEFNRQLERFAETIEKRYANLVVASVEGTLGTASLAKVKSLSAQQGSVRFVPLMIVAGDHIMNDVMGDEPDSWKVQVAAPKNECVESLGWNDKVLAVFFKHLDSALEQL